MKEQPSNFVLSEMKKQNYSDGSSKVILKYIGVITSEAFMLSEVEITDKQKKQISWFLSAMGNRAVETESLFTATIVAAMLNPPAFDRDQLVGEYSTEHTIMHLMWMFNVGYSAKMFVLGQLNVETGEKLTKGNSLTVNQWFALKDLLVKTIDGKTQTKPADMAKAIYKTVFKNSSTHFDFVREPFILKEEPEMNINIEQTPAPEKQQHPFHKMYSEAKVILAFNPLWENGTGYFNGAAEGPDAPVLGDTVFARSEDNTGRKILFFNYGGSLNVVFFERYVNEKETIAVNTVHELGCKYWVLCRPVDAEEFNDIIQYNMGKYENNHMKDLPTDGTLSGDTFTFSKPIPAEEFCATDPIPETPPTPKEDEMANQKPDDWKFHPTNDQGTYNKKPIIEEVPSKAKPEEPEADAKLPWYKNAKIVGGVVGVIAIGSAIGYFGFRK